MSTPLLKQAYNELEQMKSKGFIRDFSCSKVIGCGYIFTVSDPKLDIGIIHKACKNFGIRISYSHQEENSLSTK